MFKGDPTSKLPPKNEAGFVVHLECCPMAMVLPWFDLPRGCPEVPFWLSMLGVLSSAVSNRKL